MRAARMVTIVVATTACGTEAPADKVFACGGTNQCHSATEFCDDEIWGGVYDGGIHVGYCQSLPTDCHTCACLAAAGWPGTPCSGAPSCTEENGVITVTESGCN